MCFQVLSSALSSVIRYHNRENLPRHGICVANHTSPIDVLVLACDNCYALVSWVAVVPNSKGRFVLRKVFTWSASLLLLASRN